MTISAPADLPKCCDCTYVYWLDLVLLITSTSGTAATALPAIAVLLANLPDHFELSSEGVQ